MEVLIIGAGSVLGYMIARKKESKKKATFQVQDLLTPKVADTILPPPSTSNRVKEMDTIERELAADRNPTTNDMQGIFAHNSAEDFAEFDETLYLSKTPTSTNNKASKPWERMGGNMNNLEFRDPQESQRNISILSGVPINYNNNDNNDNKMYGLTEKHVPSMSSSQVLLEKYSGQSSTIDQGTYHGRKTEREARIPDNPEALRRPDLNASRGQMYDRANVAVGSTGKYDFLGPQSEIVEKPIDRDLRVRAKGIDQLRNPLKPKLSIKGRTSQGQISSSRVTELGSQIRSFINTVSENISPVPTRGNITLEKQTGQFSKLGSGKVGALQNTYQGPSKTSTDNRRYIADSGDEVTRKQVVAGKMTNQRSHIMEDRAKTNFNLRAPFKEFKAPVPAGRAATNTQTSRALSSGGKVSSFINPVVEKMGKSGRKINGGYQQEISGTYVAPTMKSIHGENKKVGIKFKKSMGSSIGSLPLPKGDFVSLRETLPSTETEKKNARNQVGKRISEIQSSKDGKSDSQTIPLKSKGRVKENRVEKGFTIEQSTFQRVVLGAGEEARVGGEYAKVKKNPVVGKVSEADAYDPVSVGEHINAGQSVTSKQLTGKVNAKEPDSASEKIRSVGGGKVSMFKDRLQQIKEEEDGESTVADLVGTRGEKRLPHEQRVLPAIQLKQEYNQMFPWIKPGKKNNNVV